MQEEKVTHGRTAAGSAGGQQACDEVAGSPAVLSLGVSDGAVLLSQVKPQLTFVSEVEVAFFTLKGGKRKDHFKSPFELDSFYSPTPTAILHSSPGLPLRTYNY